MTEQVESDSINQLVLVCGESATGKSASLQNIRNQENWLYFGTEAGKRLPFRNKFQVANVTDPLDIPASLEWACSDDGAHLEGAVIDSSTFMMDMFESQYVIGSANTQTAWGDYAQFFKNIMQKLVPTFARPVIIMAHTKKELNEAAGRWEISVPIKGALRNNGVEAYFSTVVVTKKVPLKELEGYKNDLLHITEDDLLVGYKHVFQTRITKTTTGERIRSPMGLFTVAQTFIDNDCQQLLDHLNAFYAN